MESSGNHNVPLRPGKKIRKRRELNALIAQSIVKRGHNIRRSDLKSDAYSNDKLLSASTDDPEDYVWPYVINDTNHNSWRTRKCIFVRICRPLLFITVIILFVGFIWLYFDLRQQIYEYRQKIEEVSATSRSLPEALQKWHETSTYLLKNQSVLLLRFTEMQHTVQVLRSNFSELRTCIDAQHNYTKDEKLVADFGAKLEAISMDIESMKSHYNTVADNQKILQNNFNNLMLNFTAIHDFNDTIFNKTVRSLIERFEDITAHVAAIEKKWPENVNKILNLEKNEKRFDNRFIKLQNDFVKIERTLETICDDCKDGYSNITQPHDYANNEKVLDHLHSVVMNTTTPKVNNKRGGEEVVTIEPSPLVT